MRRRRRLGSWLAIISILVPAASRLATAEQLPCRPSLVPCNYGEHFNGKVHLTSFLKVAGDPASDQVEDVTATIVDGTVTCAGTIDGKPVRGAGLVAVERGSSMEDEPGQPWYDITVACPDAEGKASDFGDATMKTYKQRDTTGFKTLAGKTDEDQSDPANGVSGKISLEWSLSRSDGPNP